MRGFCASGCLALFLLSACSSTPPPQKLTDAQIVYCHSPQRRADLVVAVNALNPQGKVQDGTLDAWRENKANAAAFVKACAAIAPAPPDKPADSGGSPNLWAILLPVLVGGAIALVSAEWRNSATVAVKHADDLGEAADKFQTAAKEYIEAREASKPPKGEPFDEARAELLRQLDRVKRFRSRWEKVVKAKKTLNDELTRQKIDEAMKPQPDGKVSGAAVEARLTGLGTQLARFDAALRRPWWPHRGVR
ncbi:hypothetical protein OIE66_36975 [Nonomuraea sp. NBC_01738]|uniref:hypothetical protein n=1 Tax=Nonomuraea sp. NBC_01738 TaxID=2976003 RepID=UPI002E0F3461|nr:hypothetical protein OIE66_36975 [Nonomuraea sp. NBC_01738]